MAKKITIPTDDKPTPASRKGWTGAGWGVLAGGIVGSLVTHNPMVAIGIAAASGGTGYVIGNSVFGQKNKEKELQTGKKEVSEPSFWNYKLAKGFIKGAVVDTVAKVVSRTLLKRNPVVGGIVRVGGRVAGIYMTVAGGLAGRHEMSQEYKEAKEITGKLPENANPSPEVPQAATSGKFTVAEDVRRLATEQQTQQGAAHR